MAKRGNVSVFIIIGLFILLVIAMLISMQTGLIPMFKFTPKELQPIKAYTQTCIQDTAEQGISIMSVQGGYIELPEDMRINPDTYINLGFKIPLWLYMGKNKRPSIQEMQNELSSYIDRNLPACLNSYEPFQDQYEIKPLDNISSTAVIKDREVSIATDYYLRVRQHGSEEYSYLEDFSADISSDLGRMYSLASQLMDYENSNSFLENYTDEMIATSDYLPYEGMKVSCRPELWRVSDMKEYTQQLVMHNLYFLQFLNTDYRESGIPYYDKQYKVDFTGNNFKDVKVNVIYNPAWGMDFDVLPSKDGVSKPYEFSISKYLMTCVKVYHHKYSLDYPVMFQLIDSEDPESHFYFASPVIMRRGLPNRYQSVLPWPTDYDITGSRQYCANTSQITLFDTDATGNIVATPSIRPRRQYSLRVFARDALTDTMLPGVNISYQCVMFRCPIGMTSYPRSEENLITGASPLLASRFPDCTSGLVTAERPGYQTAREQMTVSKDTDGSQVVVDMYPLKHFDYTIKVVEDHNGIISIRDLNEDEHVLMNINNDEQMFSKSIVWPSDEDYFTNLSLMVGDFEYSLDMKLVTDQNYLGGLLLNWSVSADSLTNNNYIVFYVLEKDPAVPPTTPEEFQAIYDYAINNSYKYPPKLR